MCKICTGKLFLAESISVPQFSALYKEQKFSPFKLVYVKTIMIFPGFEQNI